MHYPGTGPRSEILVSHLHLAFTERNERFKCHQTTRRQQARIKGLLGWWYKMSANSALTNIQYPALCQCTVLYVLYSMYMGYFLRRLFRGCTLEKMKLKMKLSINRMVRQPARWPTSQASSCWIVVSLIPH